MVDKRHKTGGTEHDRHRQAIVAHQCLAIPSFMLKNQFVVGVEISYIDQEIQKWLFEYIKDNGAVKLNQITLLRTQLQTGAITQAKMITLLNGSQPGKAPSSKLTFTEKKLREYFPANYSTSEMRGVIEELLQEWKQRQDTEFMDSEEV